MDAEASKRAIEVMDELEIERDLRRKAEDRSMALQQRVDKDANGGEWVRLHVRGIDG